MCQAGRAGARAGPVPTGAAGAPACRGRGPRGRGGPRGGGRAPPPAAAVGRAAALTAADLQDRWWNNYSGDGVGFRGGTWRYTGYNLVRFRLARVRLLPGLPVSGTATWDRLAETMTVSLDVPGGHLDGTWDTRSVGARALLTGHLNGHPVRLSLPAP